MDGWTDGQAEGGITFPSFFLAAFGLYEKKLYSSSSRCSHRIVVLREVEIGSHTVLTRVRRAIDCSSTCGCSEGVTRGLFWHTYTTYVYTAHQLFFPCLKNRNHGSACSCVHSIMTFGIHRLLSLSLCCGQQVVPNLSPRQLAIRVGGLGCHGVSTTSCVHVFSPEGVGKGKKTTEGRKD